MQIDWFTFAAQIVNFLALVWLLKKFLYKPILAAMERRKSAIAEKFKEAADKRHEAALEKERFQKMQEDLEDSIADELKKASREAEELRVKLLDQVRRETDTARQQWQQAIEKEKKGFLEQTTLTLASQLEKLSRSALQDLADEQLEERIVDAFLRKLRQEPETVEEIKSMTGGEHPLIITSAFELPDNMRERLTQGLNEIFERDLRFEFQRNSDLIAGISFEVDGKKAHWDIDRYLEEFSRELSAILDTIQIEKSGE